MIRRLAAAAAALLAVAGLAVIGAPAASAAGALKISSCTTTTNVVVAVDFSHFGGPIVRACGATPTTGYQLLNEGGLHSTGTHQYGDAFVCRIAASAFNGGTAYPTTKQTPCFSTPPATAYWSYWHWSPGSADVWTYTKAGAMGTNPGAGSVDLWVFGSTDNGGTTGSGHPSYPPSAVRATNKAPKPKPTPTSTAAAHAPNTRSSSAAGGTGPTTNGSVPTGSATTRTSAAASSSTPSGASSSSRAPTSTPTPTGSGATALDIVDESPGNASGQAVAVVGKSNGGSPWPVVIGAVLAALLLSGAGFATWRRRTS